MKRALRQLPKTFLLILLGLLISGGLVYAGGNADQGGAAEPAFPGGPESPGLPPPDAPELPEAGSVSDGGETPPSGEAISPEGTALGPEGEEALPPPGGDSPERADSPAGEAGLEPASGDEDLPEEEGLSPEEKILDMDIKTSTLSELAAWCRNLGLSEGGAREDLAARLRDYYGFSAPAGEEESSDKKVITIESAKSTEYFTLETVDEEYARLQGDVIVSLKDGDAVHRIKAWEILYNRTRNLLTASGGVEYIKTENDTIETFKGDRITVDLDDWSSILLEGLSERGMSDEDTVYRFAGTLISRTDEEVTVLTKAEITNAKNEEALWSLRASKIWLLPGSDFAILNAILKVGEVPVLYIPYFYYPADEIVFHPVMGYRSREGNFLQTTTYILGRPQTTDTAESSFTKILGNSPDMEKKREGIFLRSTGRKSQDLNDVRLSLFMDFYANLGAYIGTELALPKKGIFGASNLSAGIGFTRDVHLLNNSYTPFAKYDGTSDWNTGWLFAYEVPFRFRLLTTGSLSGTYGTFNWSLPFYSDPYVNQDFLDRVESMDLMSMLMDWGKEEEEDETANTALGSYEWRLSGSLNPSVNSLAPYITSLSVSSITSTVAFRTRNSTRQANTVSPDRLFFFPDKITLYSINTSVAGTPFTIGEAKTAAAPETAPEGKQEDPLKDIGVPRSPWGTAEKKGDAPQNAKDPDQMVPPPLSQRFDIPLGGGPRFSIDYRLNPSSASEMQFRSTQQNWPEVEDIDWGELSSILTMVRSDGSIGFNLNQSGGSLYTASMQFSGTGSWQDYVYLNEEAEEYTDASGAPDSQKINDARLRNYNADYFTTSYSFSSTVKPLYQSTVWGNSSLQYTLKGLLAKSVFKGTGEDPSWDIEPGEWDKESLDTHQITANFTASLRDQVQNLSIITDLAPEDDAVTGNATFRFLISETNFRGKIFEPYDEELRVFEPLYFTETLRFTPKVSFQQTLTFDPELKEYTNSASTLSLGGLSASLTAIRAYSYRLESQGWIQNTGEENLKFGLQSLRVVYNQSFKKESLWKNRLSFAVNVNSALNFDLQRYTYSQFSFTMGVSMKITNFLDLSFSATSINAVVFRYIQNFPFFDLPVELPGERNVFIDLLNSFRFDNEELRKSSGFKLKSFNIALTHHLGDWNAKLGITLSPYLDQTSFPYRYKFNNEISFLVQWVPLSEIKTEMSYDKDKLVFK
ncbi:MAG: LPS-assembly protein LptD [Treponema sp.]|jgi:hypothetical protein|nr:LPS-assembly protein LptD [Treponema sp.]